MIEIIRQTDWNTIRESYKDRTVTIGKNSTYDYAMWPHPFSNKSRLLKNAVDLQRKLTNHWNNL